MSVDVDSDVEEKGFGFLTEKLPISFKTFPMVALHSLMASYSECLKRLDAQLVNNKYDAVWSNELKATRASVSERLRSVKDITSLYASSDSRGREKGVALLRIERLKAHQLYTAFISEHPKG